jgi:1-deoxy-D-xylulose-5-phosphate reductoisomerase
MTRGVAILGSTGSIGTQALDVLEHHRDEYRVVALAAGRDSDLLRTQAAAFDVPTDMVRACADEPGALAELASLPEADVVLNAVVGFAGLPATLAALNAGKRLALANKESLIAAGPVVAKARSAGGGEIIPVDSEHSAIWQCLRAGRPSEVNRIVLTASGGPFRGRTREQLRDVTIADALAHPTWSMGAKITVDSSTLMNKGLEVIEAHELFGVGFDRIDVVVHPQSIVHSMVTFVDGSTIAQASPPDMRLPIALALGWPARVPGAAAPCDFTTASTWHFEPLDDEVFPAVALAREAGSRGGCLTAVYNAANEEAAAAFLDGRIRFPAIVRIVAEVLRAADQWSAQPATVDDVLEAQDWARARAGAAVKKAAAEKPAQEVVPTR